MTAHKRPSTSDIRAALRVLGQAGGSVSSPAKTAAAKRNAEKRWADVRAAKAAEGKPR